MGMINLAGVGTLLRRGVDDVGSFITGQPAQSNPTPQAQPIPQAQIPHQQAPLQIRPPQMPTLNQNPGMPNAAPGQMQVHTTPFQTLYSGHVTQPGQTPPAQTQPSFTMPHPAQQQQAPQQFHQPTPNPIGMFNPNQPGLFQPHANQVRGGTDVTHNPVTNFIGAATKDIGNAAYGTGKAIGQIASIPYNIAKTVPASLTNNQTAFNNASTSANRDISTGAQFLQFLPRSVAQLRNSVGEGLGGNGGNQQLSNFIPHGGFQQAILGNQPIQSLQQGYKDVRAQQGTQHAVTQTALNTLMDALALKGGVDTAAKIGIKGADLANNAHPLDENGAINPKAGGLATKPTPQLSNEVIPPIKSVKEIIDGLPRNVALSKDDTLPRLQQTGIALNKPTNMDVDSFARTFGTSRDEAIKLTKQEKLVTKNAPNEPIKLTRTERQDIIKNNESQQPIKPIDLKTHTENIKGAIAEAVGNAAHERSLYDNVDSLQHKLSPEDRNLMYRYDNGESLESLAKEAKQPKQFLEAATAATQALDHSLGLDRSAGGVTLRQKNYIPHSYQASPETMDKLGIDPSQRFHSGLYQGFRDTSAKYPSYTEAAKQTNGLLKPLRNNPFDDIHEYGRGAAYSHEGDLLKQTLLKAVPNDIGEPGDVSIGGNRLHSAPHDLPFTATDRVNQQLNGFREQAYINNTAVRLLGKGFDKANGLQKKLLFSLAWFHQVNISLKYAAATLGSGHAKLFGQGLTEAIASGINPKIAAALDKKYLTDGTADWQRENGIQHGVQQTRYRITNNDSLGQKFTIANERFNPLDMMHRSMGNFINAYANVLSQFAKDRVPTGTPEATALAQEYNALLGHIDGKISNLTPFVSQTVKRGGLAPQFLLSQGKILKDATIGTKGAAYGKTGIGLTNANDVARTAVIGNRIVNTAIAAGVTYIASGQMPTFQNLMQRGGITGGFTGPNYDASEKSQKGKHQIEYLPTDYAGLLESLIKDPAHFGQARYSPAIASITRFVTNKDWNGQPLADPNDPNALRKRAEGAAKGMLPIGVQNLTNSKLSTAQKLEQEFGTRAHDSPTDPQVVSTKAYYDNKKQYLDYLAKGQLSKIDPALQDVSLQEAHQLVLDYNAKHPASSTDPNTGIPYPKGYDANSGSEKHDAYVNSNQKTGAEELSPTFMIDKHLSEIDPTRPHDPIFDLNGNGVGFTLDKDKNIVGSKTVPQAQIALDYGSMKATDDQRALILAANPWLSDYEKSVGDYGKNYQQNTTDYLKGNGYTDQAVADYMSKHPNNIAPIAPPSFSPTTQKLMDDYGSITDPTQKVQFFQDNAAELGRAFAADAVYKNQKGVAQGALPLQTRPSPTPEQAASLAQLQKNPNHDKAIGRANAQLIKAHPELAQYLADSGLFTTAKDLARYQFQDPSHPGLNAGQLLNLGRPIDQSTLSGVTNLGKYDIGKDANGKFSFLGAGGTGKFADGTASGSGGSGYSKRIKIFKRYTKPIRIYRARKTITSKSTKLKTPRNNIQFKNNSKHTLRVADDAISHVKLG